MLQKLRLIKILYWATLQSLQLQQASELLSPSYELMGIVSVTSSNLITT